MTQLQKKPKPCQKQHSTKPINSRGSCPLELRTLYAPTPCAANWSWRADASSVCGNDSTNRRRTKKTRLPKLPRIRTLAPQTRIPGTTTRSWERLNTQWSLFGVLLRESCYSA